MIEMNISPFATNVLDIVNRTQAFSHTDNISVSRYLNSLPLCSACAGHS